MTENASMKTIYKAEFKFKQGNSNCEPSTSWSSFSSKYLCVLSWERDQSLLVRCIPGPAHGRAVYMFRDHVTMVTAYQLIIMNRSTVRFLSSFLLSLLTKKKDMAQQLSRNGQSNVYTPSAVHPLFPDETVLGTFRVGGTGVGLGHNYAGQCLQADSVLHGCSMALEENEKGPITCVVCSCALSLCFSLLFLSFLPEKHSNNQQ